MTLGNKIIKTLVLSTLTVFLFTACAKSISLNKSGSNLGNNSQSSGGAISAPAPVASWAQVTSAMNSAVSGGPYNQYPLIHIDPVAETIELLIPLEISLGAFTPILPGSISVNGVTGVTVGPAIMPDGTSGWAVTVPLKYLLQANGAGLQPLGTLPNGNPLPYFPSAEIDGIAITLPQQPNYQVTLYIALKAVAVYVSIPSLSNLPIGFGYNLVNQNQTRNIGYFALEPSSGSFSGGIYVAAQIPTDVSLMLNSLVSF